MCAVRKNNNDEFLLDRDYEINFVNLDTEEREHTHDFAELVYTIAGKGIHIIDGKEYHVKSGDMLMINYHCRHTVIPVENLHYADIMLKPGYLSRTLHGMEDLFLILQLSQFADLSPSIKRENILLHFDHSQRKRIELLLEWTAEEQKNKYPAAELILHSSLSLLLGLAFRKMAENQNTRLSVNELLLQYIRRNCHGRLIVSEIAKSCGYSSEHFSRLFRAYTGKTPLEYISDCRINTAKELLSKTDKPIEDILSECGFTNRTAFFRKFSQTVGVTPLQYRKNQK